MEGLERRNLLAGDVAVAVDDGDLLITGDDADNQIMIVQTGDEEYTVTGLDGTLINGEDEYVAEGVDDDVHIEMGDGDDAVEIVETEVPDDLNVSLGSGDDALSVQLVTVNDDMEVDGGGGDDAVRVAGTATTPCRSPAKCSWAAMWT
jgi:hypothetical protein